MFARLIVVFGVFAFVLALVGPQIGMGAADIITRKAARDAATSAPGAGQGPSPAAPSSIGGIALSRSGDSHFRADMTVNGAPVRMLVDSGASIVVLREADARAAGITVDPAAYTGTALTAGGQVRVAPIVIDRLAIGSIERRNVQAAVMQGDALPESLLGQSFLTQLSETRTAGDVMQLR